MYRLRSYDITPPGGFSYHQTDGIDRVFRSSPMIEDTARSVMAFRKGNNLARATYPECLFDVSCYTCSRLNARLRPQFCVAAEPGVETIALNANAPGIAPCTSCGAPV